MTIKNIPEYYPIELLHWAAMPDENIYMIKNILSFHPEYINHTNKDGDNSLMIASRIGNIEIVKFFLEKTNINFTQCSNEGNFFMIALKYGQQELAELIFTKFTDKFNLEQMNSKKETIFHLAALKGYDFIFEESSFSFGINKLDIKNQHCLFLFVEGYPYHLNYLCFELIQEYLNKNDLLIKNIQNETIFDYIDKIIQKSVLKADMAKTYEPILNILNYKIGASI